jgi:hypothetical protein
VAKVVLGVDNEESIAVDIKRIVTCRQVSVFFTISKMNEAQSCRPAFYTEESILAGIGIRFTGCFID